MAITSIKNLKEFSTNNDRFEGAHTLCPGCAHSMIVRELMNCTDDNLVVATNTGCLEVSTAVLENVAPFKVISEQCVESVETHEPKIGPQFPSGLQCLVKSLPWLS